MIAVQCNPLLEAPILQPLQLTLSAASPILLLCVAGEVLTRLASSEYECGRKAANKLGFPQDIRAYAAETSKYFHNDPIVAASFIWERIVPWLKQPAAASWIWRFPRKK